MAKSNIFIFILFLCIQFLSPQSLNFTYNGFNNSTNLIYQLGATVIEPSGALRLTNTTQNVIGHAFYATPISMFINNTVSSFSTHFVFQIRPSGSDHGGYGLAFTISPSPGFPGTAAGHYFGVFNSGNDGNTTNHIFMVEFDTVNGFQEASDSGGNHVAINVNGMEPVASQSASYYTDTRQVTEEVRLESGERIQAWIDYDGVRGEVNVTVAPNNFTKPNRPLITEQINLASILLQDMYVGFSAATGASQTSSHYILGWSFGLNGTAFPLDVNRLPFVPPDRLSSSRPRVRVALIATLSVVVFILLAILGTIIIYRKSKEFEALEDWELDCPRRFKYKDLVTATKGFKESEVIGAGGFGSVYKGVLPTSGAEVAVKKIKSNNTLQGFREFAAEIESLGRLRHRHLVNLLGWCKYKNDLLLVYEYIPNGSLDSLLHSTKNRTVLSWDQRFNIVKGIASGLLYLHEEWERVVIHRDVKSSNVLIDHDMNPRLGDFGLARLYDHGKDSHTTNVVGTIGYIAPELTRIGKASTSSDVFAYGIVLLEVACGRGPVVYEADRNVILVDWVLECMQTGNIFNAVDRKLNSVYESEEIELVLGLGLLCSHPKAEARPTMREVVKYLNGDEILPVFEKLSSAGSRRVDEVTARLLALGLSTNDQSSSSSNTTLYNSSTSVGKISAGSIVSGR